MKGIQNPYTRLGRYSADLCLFLLVAEHATLSGAAQAAGISQPRVSQRMRALEDGLGCALLTRNGRGVGLTGEGETLRHILRGPLAEAADGLDRFMRRSRRKEVVILSDIAFASFRLLPEFASLVADFSDVSISLLTLQTPDDIKTPEADLVISMGEFGAQGGAGRMLFRERVSAICSPDYLERAGPVRSPRDLAGHTLIDLAATGGKAWYTWDSWLEESGCRQESAREFIAFNSYDHVIRAVRGGLGVALGWEGLIDVDQPDSGIVRACEGSLESSRGYILRILPGRATPDTTRVFEWLCARFEDRTGG